MTTEESLVNQMVLRNITGVTSTSESLADYGNIHLVMAVGSHKILVLYYTKGAVATTALLSAPPTKAKSLLQLIFDDLDRLELRSNYHFRPSKHAMRSARFYILETYAKMGAAFPRPFFVLDGENGIIIKWVRNGYTVRLNCLSNESDDDYIYFE